MIAFEETLNPKINNITSNQEVLIAPKEILEEEIKFSTWKIQKMNIKEEMEHSKEKISEKLNVLYESKKLLI